MELGNKNCKNHRNQPYHEKVDYRYFLCEFLVVEARLKTRLEQCGFSPTFFEVTFAQNLYETHYAKDTEDMECKI